MSRLIGLVLAISVGQAAADGPPLSPTERITHLLDRLGFGPSPALLAEVRAEGIERWLDQQLDPANDDDPTVRSRLVDFATLDLTCGEIVARYRKRPPPAAGRALRSRIDALRRQPRRELQDAVLLRAVYSRYPAREAICDFFRNHFNVWAFKGNVKFFAPAWERDVLRAGLLGRFGEMLAASARHPAMLVYLDNALSRRPPTDQELRELGRRVRRDTRSRRRERESIELARQRGLNENYARELLELHTLGVDNGYSQRDVIEVARALTGWTIHDSDLDGVGFWFRPEMHAGGDKLFLGRRIRQNRLRPITEGEKVLSMLERHPRTARFITAKLCRHFVDDRPPEAMVERVTAVFSRSKGSIPAVIKAIVSDPEFFARSHYRSKFKRPFEFLVSALRITEARILETDALQRSLLEMAEPIYGCEDPTGYSDGAEAWSDPGVMVPRWRFAVDLAGDRIEGVEIPAVLFSDLPPQAPEAWKDQLAERIIPAGVGPRTAAALEAATQGYLAKHPRPRPRELGPILLGLMLGSPEFQRQ